MLSMTVLKCLFLLVVLSLFGKCIEARGIFNLFNRKVDSSEALKQPKLENAFETDADGQTQQKSIVYKGVNQVGVPDQVFFIDQPDASNSENPTIGNEQTNYLTKVQLGDSNDLYDDVNEDGDEYIDEEIDEETIIIDGASGGGSRDIQFIPESNNKQVTTFENSELIEQTNDANTRIDIVNITLDGADGVGNVEPFEKIADKLNVPKSWNFFDSNGNAQIDSHQDSAAASSNKANEAINNLLGERLEETIQISVDVPESSEIIRETVDITGKPNAFDDGGSNGNSWNLNGISKLKGVASGLSGYFNGTSNGASNEVSSKVLNNAIDGESSGYNESDVTSNGTAVGRSWSLPNPLKGVASGLSGYFNGGSNGAPDKIADGASKEAMNGGTESISNSGPNDLLLDGSNVSTGGESSGTAKGISWSLNGLRNPLKGVANGFSGYFNGASTDGAFEETVNGSSNEVLNDATGIRSSDEYKESDATANGRSWSLNGVDSGLSGYFNGGLNEMADGASNEVLNDGTNGGSVNGSSSGLNGQSNESVNVESNGTVNGRSWSLNGFRNPLKGVANGLSGYFNGGSNGATDQISDGAFDEASNELLYDDSERGSSGEYNESEGLSDATANGSSWSLKGVASGLSGYFNGGSNDMGDASKETMNGGSDSGSNGVLITEPKDISTEVEFNDTAYSSWSLRNPLKGVANGLSGYFYGGSNGASSEMVDDASNEVLNEVTNGGSNSRPNGIPLDGSNVSLDEESNGTADDRSWSLNGLHNPLKGVSSGLSGYFNGGSNGASYGTSDKINNGESSEILDDGTTEGSNGGSSSELNGQSNESVNGQSNGTVNGRSWSLNGFRNPLKGVASGLSGYFNGGSNGASSEMVDGASSEVNVDSDGGSNNAFNGASDKIVDGGSLSVPAFSASDVALEGTSEEATNGRSWSWNGLTNGLTNELSGKFNKLSKGASEILNGANRIQYGPMLSVVPGHTYNNHITYDEAKDPVEHVNGRMDKISSETKQVGNQLDGESLSGQSGQTSQQVHSNSNGEVQSQQAIEVANYVVGRQVRPVYKNSATYENFFANLKKGYNYLIIPIPASESQFIATLKAQIASNDEALSISSSNNDKTFNQDGTLYNYFIVNNENLEESGLVGLNMATSTTTTTPAPNTIQEITVPEIAKSTQAELPETTTAALGFFSRFLYG